MINYAVRIPIFDRGSLAFLCKSQMGIAIAVKIVYSFCESKGKQMII
jgi:hypothetical protein